MRLVNIPFMAEPINWLTILVWLYLLGYLIHILDPVLPQPQQTSNKGT